jgi:homoserine dehydrogenase
MSAITVLKFGSSVLRSRTDTPLALHHVYAHWRAGQRVLAIVSAFAGETDRLLAEGLGRGVREHVLAEHVASGERESALVLKQALLASGIPAETADPAELGLRAEGEALEATPLDLDVAAVHERLARVPVLVVPGFIAADHAQRTVLLGRGGSDLSALFIAERLGARCELVKDVDGVYDHDPADRSTPAHRYERLSWRTALEVGGELVQPRAIRFAESHRHEFEVVTSGATWGTHIGAGPDELAVERGPAAPLKVVLLGLGTVGGGVYRHLLRYPQVFEVRRIAVRDSSKSRRIDDTDVPADLLTSSLDEALAEPADVIVEALGGVTPAAEAIARAISAGRSVVSANKAAIATRWSVLNAFVEGEHPALRFSAAVGGAVPVLEAAARLRGNVRKVRGIINGTCNFILEALEQGGTFADAVAEAQAAGFAEPDPSHDLTGFDAACKLQLIAHAAFGRDARVAVDVSGIDEVTPERVRAAQLGGKRLRLVAECEVMAGREDHIAGRVRVEELLADDYLAATRGAENRIEIVTNAAPLRLSGQGAGRWPTSAALLGDLLELARAARNARAGARGPGAAQPNVSLPFMRA